MIHSLDTALPADRTETAAIRAAAMNFSANLRTLRNTQPAVAELVTTLPPDMEWVFGRDGALTALDAQGKWWAGCSLPKRAAQFMLKKANLDGAVLCFLYPVHAAQIRVTLDRAKPGQALLLLTPSEKTLAMLLACEQFAAEIDAHRLYFAAGQGWESQLDELLEQMPGLSTPTQFIRPILADSTLADEMIAPAQKIFADHSTRRGQRAAELTANWKSTGLRRVCVVAPQLFRLWDDAGTALAEAMASCTQNIEISRFNPDDPASASSLALTSAATACDAIVTPNIGRGDLPDLLPEAMPWATWLTTPRIPSAHKAGPRDTLLLADREWKIPAMEKGWDANRILLAGWPPGSYNAHAAGAAAGVYEIPPAPHLALIFNTQPLEAPPHVIEYSSHRLLWESIERELVDDPFAMDGSADEYLSARMQRAHVSDEGFDRAAFLDGVILHAWQQGLARALLGEKFPLKLFGEGWNALEEFARFANGPVKSRSELVDIVTSATALVHAWPMPHMHPIDATGKPVVRANRRREAFIRDAKLALHGRLEPRRGGPDVLSAAVVLRALAVQA
ncbi:MAG TPA: hypothetical protein VFE47_15440 [Tepidisphaeraceae bacterium]|jgi:hypothetical protein|nr:hypothetical protein [Tepidisphaeraceae bacterium]